MTDDITQRLRVTTPTFKGLEISCPCAVRSALMEEAAALIDWQQDEIKMLRTDSQSKARAFAVEHNKLRADLNTAIRERDEARAEVERLRAEVVRQRAHKEALYVCVAMIERAAAGAIYSQEMIHAMALDALKSLEVKP